MAGRDLNDDERQMSQQLLESKAMMHELGLRLKQDLFLVIVIFIASSMISGIFVTHKQQQDHLSYYSSTLHILCALLLCLGHLLLKLDFFSPKTKIVKLNLGICCIVYLVRIFKVVDTFLITLYDGDGGITSTWQLLLLFSIFLLELVSLCSIVLRSILLWDFKNFLYSTAFFLSKRQKVFDHCE